MFFIDIAVPRDIDPKVNDVENVYLYDIDDLNGVVATNLEQRKIEAAKAEAIVAARSGSSSSGFFLAGSDPHHRRAQDPPSTS